MLYSPSELDEATRAVYPNGVDPTAGRAILNDPTHPNNGKILASFADGRVTVDRLLDNVDLKLGWYIPSNYAIEFMLFIRLVLGDEPENSNPKAHYFFIDCIFQQPNVKPFFMIRGIDYEDLKDRIIILASREFSKSTLVAYMFLYMAAKGEIPGFGKVNYGIYIADSMRNNVETTMKTIRSVYMESSYLRSLFEETRLIQTEVNFIRKPTSEKDIKAYHTHVIVNGGKKEEVPGRMKRTFSLVGIGASTGGRGSRDGLARPDFTVFDDMIPSEKDAASDTILRAVESTIDADILPGMNNNNNFSIMIGTPYSKKDPVYRRIEQGTWLPIVFPRGESLPDKKEEDFVSVWPDRHSFRNCNRDYRKAVKAKKEGDNGVMRRLLQEHYLRISSSEDRMISDTMIQWYKRADLQHKLYEYNLYGTSDYTTTGEQGSDLSGQAMWAVSSNSDYFLLDLCLRKQEMDAQYKETARMANYWGRLARGVQFGVETDGQQKAHIFTLKERMIRDNEYFTIAKQKGAKQGNEGILSRLEGGNKHWRFRMMLPLWQNKKIWLPEELKDTPDMIELLEELRYVTYEGFGSKYDDGCDLISQLGMMDIIFPMPGMHDSGGLGSQQRTDADLWSVHNDPTPSAFDSYI